MALPKILKLPKCWGSPAIKYPRQKVGRAEIGSYYYDPGVYHIYGIRGYDYYQITRPILITNLKIRDSTWMVDDPPHWFAMVEHAKCYSGHVVCAGLGLGLIVHALAANRKVTRITVVEREKDVIKMIKPLIPECEIIHGDFNDWSGKPDGIFYDLFVGQCVDLLNAATGTFFNLCRSFPTAKIVRIHGFNNDTFKRLADVVKATEEFLQLG